MGGTGDEKKGGRGKEDKRETERKDCWGKNDQGGGEKQGSME